MHRPGHARPLALAAALLSCALAAPAAAAPSSARRTALVQAIERSKSAVVNISAQEVVRSSAGSEFDLFFRRAPRDEVRTSLGSGFVFDAAGYVITNYHVIERGSKITVSFDDGTDLTAKVVGTDPAGDLAVLKISGRKFPVVPLGSSEGLLLGEPVIAIGNPFGLNQSVSVGVVSALHRTIRAEQRSYYDFVQTDASINPGNSGGPLLNADGEVIGVCSAIYANAQGIGFAIPIDRALRVARELVRSGEIADAFWGFDGESLDEASAKSLGVKSGAVVTTIDEGSPADKAGLRRGDVLVRVGEVPVHDADELRFLLRDVPLGKPVKVGLVRARAKLEIALAAVRLTPERAQVLFENRTGLALAELSPAQAHAAGYDTQKGIVQVKLVERDSAAARAGIRRGDLLCAVNSAEVDSLRDLRTALAHARKSGRAVVLLQRGYRLMELTFDAG
ncbi:MAG: Do family serine endopeptidase [Myxococcales bacterium]